MRVTPLTDADVEATVALWQACELTRPWNDAAADIAQARKGDNADILLGRDEQGTLVASVMVGHDGHRGWVYYVAVDPSTRGKGYGRAIMEAAEEWLRQRGILKLMLMVRPDNTKVQAFYESIGYDTQPRAIYAKWLDGREMTP
jgi:ribosomal protein S18 acetylase RimI-like enzyme